ncbi:hypothetical protein HIM_03445 [Hirsutella minnesotensis 3608]|uniref:RlpA-like protein double-psi beta-barrel domain-containing protein n=1 Tax=Hirsutella minnesotensis 3608 TaxID=1043627 RepID=A0A0F8A6I2_9HYPO|nr:hypothetical protein HIM_03445 [Hirsutella minnesotensis 3608]
MVAIANTVAAIAMAFTTAMAAPAQSAIEARSTGAVTYYYPGLGACGETNSEGDHIVAISAAIFDSQRPCNRNIRVSYEGRSVQVRVVDRCAGCAHNEIDLSPAAFKEVIGSLDKGRVTASWEWA